MLSKSDSLKIFIIVTITAIAVFLFLSYDTLKKIPDQTHEENITNSVIRGKNIWESNNCMGCHTIFGEGAYYAPELTNVYIRRSEEFLKMFLKDPMAMYPGKRKMIKYDFSDGEIDDIISYLKWCSEVDLNGFPAEPFLKKYTMTAPVNAAISIKKPDIFDKLCLTCHTLHGVGNRIEGAPILDNIGTLRDKEFLEKWLKDPKSIKINSLMPKFPLSESTIKDIVDFLIMQK
ncbi:MAG TPA: c-type cytochrome [Candidatus Azoamicus sp. OHIO2]